MSGFTSWLRYPVVAALAVVAKAASAGVVSIDVASGPGPYAPGQQVVFRVADSDPSGMCDAGLGFCFGGDFTLDFDPLKLSYLLLSPGPSLPGSISVVPGAVTPGGPFGAHVDVSFFPLDIADVPMSPTELFSVAFTVLAASPTNNAATVSVSPTDFGLGVGFTYAFDSRQIAVSIVAPSAVPEPSTGTLTLAALSLVLAVGSAGRRKAAPRPRRRARDLV